MTAAAIERLLSIMNTLRDPKNISVLNMLIAV